MKNVTNHRIIFRNFKEFYSILNEYYNVICLETSDVSVKLKMLNEHLETLGKPPVDKLNKMTSKLRPFLKQMMIKTKNDDLIGKRNPSFDFSYLDCVHILNIDVHRRFYHTRAVDKLKQMHDSYNYSSIRVISNIKDINLLVSDITSAKKFIKLLMSSKDKKDLITKFWNFAVNRLCEIKDPTITFEMDQAKYIDGANEKLYTILYNIKRSMIKNKFNNRYLVLNHKNSHPTIDLVHKQMRINGRVESGYVFMVGGVLPGYVPNKRTKKSKEVSNDKLSHVVTSMTQMVSGLVGREVSTKELKDMLDRYAKI